MGSFSGIEQTKTFKNAPYLAPGQYELAIASMLLVESSKKKGQEFFVVEFNVVTSNNPNAAPGSLVAWLVDMGHGDTALSNCTAFASAVLDCDEEDVNEEAMNRLVGPDQPATGIHVKANAFTIKTKAGSDFTKVRWDPVAGPAA